VDINNGSGKILIGDRWNHSKAARVTIYMLSKKILARFKLGNCMAIHQIEFLANICSYTVSYFTLVMPLLEYACSVWCHGFSKILTSWKKYSTVLHDLLSIIILIMLVSQRWLMNWNGLVLSREDISSNFTYSAIKWLIILL